MILIRMVFINSNVVDYLIYCVKLKLRYLKTSKSKGDITFEPIFYRSANSSILDERIKQKRIKQ